MYNIYRKINWSYLNIILHFSQVIGVARFISSRIFGDALHVIDFALTTYYMPFFCTLTMDKKIMSDILFVPCIFQTSTLERRLEFYDNQFYTTIEELEERVD